MTLVRRLARPCLASMFVTGGLDALRAPASKVPTADPIAPRIAEKLPYLPEDTEQLVRINGAVQVAAGLMLATGRMPRLSSALLAGSLVPTTLAGAPVTVAGTATTLGTDTGLVDLLQQQLTSMGITLTDEQAQCIVDNMAGVDTSDLTAMAGLLTQCGVSF